MSNKSLKYFDKNFLIVVLLIFAIPFLSYFSNNDKITFETLLDKVSIPLLTIFYAIFWIYFTQDIETEKRQVQLLNSRKEKLNGNENFIKELIDTENTLNNNFNTRQKRKLFEAYKLRTENWSNFSRTF